MKVLFQSRVDLFDRPGGDTVQMKETKKALEKLGITVDINNSLNVNLTNYDIVHIFNLDWVCEAYLYVKNAKKYNKKVVLSPIHHNLTEFKRYEKENRWGLAKLGNFLIPFQPFRDSTRNLVKSFFDLRKLKPALIQFIVGIRREQKYVLDNCDYVLVQTNKEATDLKIAYKPKKVFRWKKVVNGVNIEKFSHPDFTGAKKLINEDTYIFCVGRIEPRKNQIALIEAVSQIKKSEPLRYSNLKVVFAGAVNSHHPTYAKKFKKYLKKFPFTIYLGFVEQNILAAVYKNAKVFAVPSWFETTGLVYLEAVVAGCTSVVASGDRAFEYLDKNGIYCDPGSLSDIKKALKIALNKNTVSTNFKNKVKVLYTWDKAAKQTLQVYNSVIRD